MRNPLLLLPGLLLASLTAPAATPRPAGPAPKAARPAANPNFRQTGITFQRYYSAAWVDSARYTFSRFTAANRPRLELREQSTTRGGMLNAFRQERNQYNAAGNPTTDSTVTYTAGAPNAYPSKLTTFTYDAQGHLLVEQASVRTSGSLRPYSRDTYTYDAQGRNTRVLYESYFGVGTGGNWLYDAQLTRTFNAQNLAAEEVFDIADISGTSFSPFSKDIYTYNPAGQPTLVLNQQYTNGTYANAYRSTFAYGASGGLLSTLVTERYVSGSWVPTNQYLETYDADGNLTQEVAQQYRNGASSNTTRELYTYQRVLATTGAAALDAHLSLAPNPALATGAATLHYALPVAAPVSVEVLDALGRLVLHLPATAQPAGAHSLRLAPLPRAAGLYAVRLRVGAQSQTVKLVIE